MTNNTSSSTGRYVWSSVALMGAVHLLGFAAPLLFAPTWELVAVCVGSYYLRMFGITAGFHRLFAHRAYRTSRWFQFVLAFLGGASTQKSAVWWAAHHRDHHRYSDLPGDLHSPVRDGFWWSHIGWILHSSTDRTKSENLRDFAEHRELWWLDRHQLWPTLVYATTLLAIGGWAWLFWGYFLSTTLLWHGTFCVNSLAHVWGSRRYATKDDSRNNLWIALLTLGEGWHNNHHHDQSSARQGMLWWEVDVSYYVLRALAAAGVVWKLRPPKARKGSGLSIFAFPRPFDVGKATAVAPSVAAPLRIGASNS
jgi:stearoyl-CoA desaturase (delta-9 desaturase)